MRQVFPLILTFLLLSDTFGQTNFQFEEFSVYYRYDENSVCHGQSNILLLKYPQDRIVEEKINKIIVKEFNDLMDNEPEYFIFLNDFYKQRRFRGDSAVYNFDITTTLLFNKNKLFCLKFEMTSNCGTSISDHAIYGYSTIDIEDSALIDFNTLFDTSQTDKLTSTVKGFAKKNKIDNISYLPECDTCSHDQTKITYLDSLKNIYFLTDTKIGFFTLVFDNNEIDWQRKARQDGPIGKEFMRAEIPKMLVTRFVRKKYRSKIQ